LPEAGLLSRAGDAFGTDFPDPLSFETVFIFFSFDVSLFVIFLSRGEYKTIFFHYEEQVYPRTLL